MIHHQNRAYRTRDGIVVAATSLCGIHVESDEMTIHGPSRIVAFDADGMDETTDDGNETWCLACRMADSGQDYETRTVGVYATANENDLNTYPVSYLASGDIFDMALYGAFSFIVDSVSFTETNDGVKYVRVIGREITAYGVDESTTERLFATAIRIKRLDVDDDNDIDGVPWSLGMNDDEAPSNYMTDESREELGAEIDAATVPTIRTWIPTSDVVDYATATEWLVSRRYATRGADDDFLYMNRHQYRSLMSYISGYTSSVVPGEDAAAVCSRVSLLLDVALTMGRE